MDINLEEITHHAYLVAIFFLLGYAAIVVEQFVKFNKAATALLMATGCWSLLFFETAESVDKHLYIFAFQMFKTSQIIFFLLGALTIVEIINAHKGFQIITEKLFTSSKRSMVWGISLMTFFLSSVLDNLTTTIVMVSLLGKIIKNREERLMLCGLIVIAANAGGAWTPIGDVSTTLLWIYGQVSTLAIMRDLFLPSLICVIASIFWFTPKFYGNFDNRDFVPEKTEPGGTLVLILGIYFLIFVPFFRLITGLPPFMGMMFGLGMMWIITDILHYKHLERKHLRVTAILPKVDVSVILFYLGVLLSINSLESAGLLKKISLWFDQVMPNPLFIPVVIGLTSSLVDNVSLVAATIAMYDLKTMPTDSTFWQLIAYCAGTGGSILIIGSAAGVALMAMEQVDFMWYTKRITLPALISYFAGIGIYALIMTLI